MKKRETGPQRQLRLENEILQILRESSSSAFGLINARDEAWTKRLAAIEKNGVPDGVLEEIKRDISSIRHAVTKQTKAIEGLLNFFNASKELLKD